MLSNHASTTADDMMSLADGSTAMRGRTVSARVLLFTNVYPSRQHPANAMWLLEQVRSLRQKGIEFDVVHFNPDDTRLNYLVGLKDLIKHIRSDQYDIIHTHNTWTFYLAYVARMLTAAPLPIILTLHEQDLLSKRHKYREISLLGPLRRSIFLRRLAAAHADLAIFVSSELLEAVSPPGPAEVIPCGVDLDRFKPLDRESCRNRLEIPPDAMVVFFPASARRKRKRADLAREAFEILRARVAGTATMIVGGDIPQEQMPLYYNAANVILQTSLLEASPTIVKEALACEVPMVSTDTGDTRDMLEGIPHCFVCGDDARTLADHMQLALTHRATGGRDRIREKGLALDQVADRVIHVYSRVLSKTLSTAQTG